MGLPFADETRMELFGDHHGEAKDRLAYQRGKAS